MQEFILLGILILVMFALDYIEFKDEIRDMEDIEDEEEMKEE